MRTSIARWERGAVKDPDDASKVVTARMFDLPFGDFWPDPYGVCLLPPTPFRGRLGCQILARIVVRTAMLEHLRENLRTKSGDQCGCFGL